MSSLPVPGPQYKNAEWIWNDEANELLEKASAEHTNYNDNPVQELQRTTRNYLTSCQMFRNADSTRQVRRAVDTFLERVARDNEHLAASGMPLQPSLDPLEAASIVNLGLFDIEELFRVLPTVRDKFAVHREGLQDLLSAMESFQRDA